MLRVGFVWTVEANCADRNPSLKYNKKYISVNKIIKLHEKKKNKTKNKQKPHSGSRGYTIIPLHKAT